MTVSFAKKSGYCGYTAAAYTSARNCENLDTARVAVSIVLLSVNPLRNPCN